MSKDNKIGIAGLINKGKSTTQLADKAIENISNEGFEKFVSVDFSKELKRKINLEVSNFQFEKIEEYCKQNHLSKRQAIINILAEKFSKEGIL